MPITPPARATLPPELRTRPARRCPARSHLPRRTARAVATLERVRAGYPRARIDVLPLTFNAQRIPVPVAFGFGMPSRTPRQDRNSVGATSGF